MKNLFFVIACLLLMTHNAAAQTGNDIGKNSDIRDRIYTGGNFGLSIGSTLTSIEIAPIVGYRITNGLTAGTGFTYRYQKYKLYNTEFTTTVLGSNVFARYNIFESYFAKVEYEFLKYDEFNQTLEKNRKSYNSLLVGGGYSESLGGNSALNFTVLYNLSYSEADHGPYDSPWIIRGGVTIGF